jgi:DNA topoisomerase I
MAKNLVIVESPAKAKTLKKYLGRDFDVRASVGHVVDLPKTPKKTDIGVDLVSFEPEYAVIHGKQKVLNELKKAAKDKENIYLAPDPDREGEAIAWHIAQKLGRTTGVYRVLFNEITQRAVKEAIANPQAIDQKRFEAQQARRVLDRIVGYQLSPLLWKKVRRGLSAGRVQSVAVRLIVEREREIEAFQADEYWTVTARLEGKAPPPFAAKLFKIGKERLDHKKLRIESEARSKEILAGLDRAEWTVAAVEKKERKKNPSPPFITSKLQQEASSRLGFSPKRTMAIAQQLYEGIDLGSAGAVGLITYMRTDSTRLSADAIESARSFIGERFGADYVPEKPNFYRSRRDAQDAHEAIRPTSVEWPPDKVASFLTPEQRKLYELIWNRFVACQMTPARFDQTAVDVAAAELTFRATGQVMKFDGFIRVYTEGREEKRDPALDEENDDESRLPELAVGDRLSLLELLPEQHFTQPPPRFSQATLIKELEEKGIGRPSTYAAIMSTILNREYVQEGQDRRLRPSHLGRTVTDLLVGSFPDVFNVEFTAGMEDDLDKIEDGTENWVEALRRFYGPFRADLERAETEMPSLKGEGQPTDVACEKCGTPMVIKWGRNGEFLACPDRENCGATANFTTDDDGTIRIAKDEAPSDPCPKCAKPLAVRFSRFGKFYGCTGYPECDYKRSVQGPPKSLGIACPGCGEGDIQEKRSRRGKIFYSCSRYPECKFAAWDPPVIEPCPQCGAAYVVEKTTKRSGRFRKCVQEGCDYKEALDEDTAAESA